MNNLLMAIVVFAVGLLGGVVGSRFFSVDSVGLASMSVPVVETKEVIVQENTILEESISKVSSAVVGVKTMTGGGQTISGSGIVATSDGLLVVSADLIPKGGDFVFFVEDSLPNWKILKRDEINNLALVKVEMNNLVAVPFSADIRLGQKVFTVGKVFKDGDIQEFSNQGIIKFFGDRIETTILEKEEFGSAVLFNIKGELLGLAKTDPFGSVGAVSSETIREFLGY